MFTSSSDAASWQDRSPRKAWVMGWLCAFVLTSAVVGGVEAFWRIQGFQPDVPDTRELWSFWKDRVNHNRGRTIVLMGTSRMKADIDLQTVQDRLPGFAVVQLAIIGDESPIGLLQQFSRDDNFHGVVLCGVVAPLLEPSRWNDQRDYYEQQLAAGRVRDVACRSFLQNQFASLNPKLSGKTLLVRWLNSGQLPEPDFKHQTFRRSLCYDFSRASDLQSIRTRRASQYRELYAAANPSALSLRNEDYRELNEAVQRIRSRGGEVAFVRLPSSGDRWELEEERYPKSEFWDRFSSKVDAVSVHFQNVPALARFGCTDDSHLGSDETVAFTAALIDELRRLEVFAP